MPSIHLVMMGDYILRGDAFHLAGIDEILNGLGLLIRRHSRRGTDTLNPSHGVA